MAGCYFITACHSVKVMIFDQFIRNFTILFNHRDKKIAFTFKNREFYFISTQKYFILKRIKEQSTTIFE